MSDMAIFRQRFGHNETSKRRKPLGEELNGTRFEVVHRTCNLDAAPGFKLPKHSTLFPNAGDFSPIKRVRLRLVQVRRRSDATREERSASAKRSQIL